MTVVLTAVPLNDYSVAQQWFRLLCETYADDPPDTWDTYVATLADRAPEVATVQAFAEYVTAYVPDPLDALRALTEYGDTLADHYFAVTQRAEETQQDTAYDEADWNAFLAENGPLWAGTEDTWSPWREWFAYTATERGLTEPATAFLTWLDTQPDKVAAFAAYGVVITPPEEPSVEPELEILDSVSATLAELDRKLAARKVPGA
jgi:hypothetical protein